MMTKEEIGSKVCYFPAEFWDCDEDHPRIHTFKQDPKLKIVESEKRTPYKKNWVVSHPDRNARKFKVYIYYDGKRIFVMDMVYVDGFRAKMPIPERINGELEVDQMEHNVARIIDDTGKFEEYFVRCELMMSGKISRPVCFPK